ncbi:alpha-amylase family protein [Dyadobacter sandarakinus]|uniref:Family 10 glycosylhydrolase n=1 Tax=Dyadobacter sandarakinus TaxID=2747268 RepID=A0ABX7I6D7_9BACT|nr:alpha-amylase family protein [Dyadobacter sandarakinus]QRR01288.1 family 10 glycosylhydrolase [Dyadobacter sandarakinus]
MTKTLLALLALIGSTLHTLAQDQGGFWWKRNNLRVIQTNLPDYEAATLNADSLLADLREYSANTLIINAGGIMAFYPTKLDFHYQNPYAKPNTLKDVITKCHEHNIRVIVRVDFSRVHERIYKAHPDWCYLSPKGERMINTDMYVVSINAPYVQDRAFRIIGEIMDTFPVDGIFLNMPGYQVRNPYEDKYQGIDQNEYDQKAFAAYSGGLKLPLEENSADPVYRKYLDFKKHSVEQWSKKLHEMVKAKNPQTAICTYMDRYVDIIRHESQSNTTLPYWPYTASDNVGNASNSYPDHIISNGSIQQLSFQSRYNAVEPVEAQIRLYENIANGSGLDLSMMGDMRGYEDERNFPVFKKVYGHHQKFEQYYGKYKSVARILVVSPGSWAHGEPAQEYRGIQLMLREAHIPFDIMENTQLGNQAGRLKDYQTIILPEIVALDSTSLTAIKAALDNGTHLIATNRSLADHPEMLAAVFGAKIEKKDYDGAGNYLVPDNRGVFKRFEKQKMISWKYNLGMYDLKGADQTFLPILGKGRPGPPEIIGGHEPTGYYAMGLKNHPKSKAIILPMNLGRLYYMHGYQQDKNILLDVIDYIIPEASRQLRTNAPARVEVILKEFARNIPENQQKQTMEGLILHLINLTGFSGNTYFEPLPVRDLTFEIQSDFKPSKVFAMKSKRTVPFKWEKNILKLSLSELEDYEGIVIMR